MVALCETTSTCSSGCDATISRSAGNARAVTSRPVSPPSGANENGSASQRRTPRGKVARPPPASFPPSGRGTSRGARAAERLPSRAAPRSAWRFRARAPGGTRRRRRSAPARAGRRARAPLRPISESAMSVSPQSCPPLETVAPCRTRKTRVVKACPNPREALHLLCLAGDGYFSPIISSSFPSLHPELPDSKSAPSQDQSCRGIDEVVIARPRWPR